MKFAFQIIIHLPLLIFVTKSHVIEHKHIYYYVSLSGQDVFVFFIQSVYLTNLNMSPSFQEVGYVVNRVINEVI